MTQKLLTLVFTLLVAQLALAADHIVVPYKNSKGSCSSTIVKYKGQCRRVTNFHCLNGETEGVLYSDASLDLAELSLSAEENLQCASLEEFKVISADQLNRSCVQFVSQGIIDHKNVIAYPNSVQGMKACAQPYRLYVNDEKEFDISLLKVDDLEIRFGMSGGALAIEDEKTQKSSLVGINREFMPIFSASYFITTLGLEKFLNKEIKHITHGRMNTAGFIPLKRSHLFQKAQEAGGGGGGGEGGTHGDGSEGEGGTHGDGTNSKSKSLELGFDKTNIKSYQTPDEGIIDPLDPSKQTIVLGGISKNTAWQVNNVEGYRRLFAERGFYPLMKSVERKRNSALDSEIRAGLFDRLQGSWKTQSYAVEKTNLRKTKNKIYSAINGDLQAFGESESSIQFDAISQKEAVITIHMKSIELNKVAENKIFARERKRGEVLQFKLSMNEDDSLIRLTGLEGENNLICINKHLLKLVCSGVGTEFYLSLNRNLADGVMVFGLTRKNNGLMNVKYGDLIYDK